MGDKFYIVLLGTVAVMIPNPDAKDFKKRFDEFQKEKAAQSSRRSQQKPSQKFSNFLSPDLPVMAKAKSAWVSDGGQVERLLTPSSNENMDVISENLLDEEEGAEEAVVQHQHTGKVKGNSKLSAKLPLPKVEEAPLFIEFTQLKSGKSFGELALIKNKPRAATIRCVEDCHFAVMSKDDYEKVLQKIEMKKIQKNIEFMHQLPFFKVWTKTSLSKLQYSFEQRAFIRNQVVFREGEEAAFVYIIRSGDFEVTKRFKKEEVKEVDVMKLLAPRAEEETEEHGFFSRKEEEKVALKDNSRKKTLGMINAPNVQMASRLRNTETYKIMLLGVGQMFGEDDVIHERPHSQTVICRSNQGVVFCMKTLEFFRKLKANEECWKIILHQVYQKDLQMHHRMSKIERVFHRDPNKERQEGVVQKTDPKSQKYPSILRKHRVQVTQERMEDFRDALKEIVKKQKDDRSLSPDTSSSPPQRTTHGRMTVIRNVEEDKSFLTLTNFSDSSPGLKNQATRQSGLGN